MSQKNQQILCPQCENLNTSNSRFCYECGYALQGLGGKVRGLQKRLSYQARDRIETLRQDLSKEIDQYLTKIDTNKSLKIANVNIPENQRQNMRRALLSFQNRIGGSHSFEESEEYQDWLKDLPQRLESEKCLVCFGSWKGSEEQIVICRFCQSGGHESHMKNWIEGKPSCPLCREAITVRDLVQVSF